MLFFRKLMVTLIITLGMCHGAVGQLPATSIHALTDSIRLHPKPGLILISTRWCTYCQLQKAQLKKNKDFQAASPYFYFSELDAETPENITFNGRTYAFQRTGVSTGIHELAYALGNADNRLAFPTWVLIDERFNILLTYPGVLDKKALTELIKKLQE